jgi:hypothetical protein
MKMNRVSDTMPRTEPAEFDPWVHRADRMRCRTCMWYVPKRANAGEITVLGRCRRHAPTTGGYPVVFESDWCGDHKLDENKNG